LPPGWDVVAETNLFVSIAVRFIWDVGAVVDGDGVPWAAAGGDDAPVSDATVEKSSGGDGWGLFASPASIARGCPGGEALHKCGSFRVQPARFTLGATLATLSTVPTVALGSGFSTLTTLTRVTFRTLLATLSTVPTVALGSGLSTLATVPTVTLGARLARVALGASLSSLTTLTLGARLARVTLHRYRRRNRTLRTGGGNRRQIQRHTRANINARVRQLRGTSRDIP